MLCPYALAAHCGLQMLVEPVSYAPPRASRQLEQHICCKELHARVKALRTICAVHPGGDESSAGNCQRMLAGLVQGLPR
eukprot:CAMPEP_0173131730 /NCGR_PEP_ID=MMETSP1102-20130122/60813_1 /TAXON_ID=49646 /ORGANISM="Geminigera sp., Strain Caron Lab Isolate" /LENGTH=78 /DNA_ID=CAMNT_0014043099 /DNA_START=1055 /DNA_END=1288 /DNA_ORIENTATION=+